MAQLATDLTDYATLAGELGWQSNDPRLPRLVSFASDVAATYMGRKTPVSLEYVAGFTELVKTYRRPRLILSKVPVLSVASITWQGFTFDPSEYSIQEPESGFIYRQVGWPYSGLLRPGLLQEDDMPGTEDRLTTVVYTGGWVTPGQVAIGGFPPRTLPYDIEDAVIQIARDRALHVNTDGSLIHEELGTAKAYYLQDGMRTIPPAAQEILNRYRREFPV